MTKTVCDLQVFENKKLNYNNNLITFQSNEILDIIDPGQFVNVLVKDTPETFLRRPFSINMVDYSNNRFTILVKSIGAGSRKIASFKVGDIVNIVFPLGNGFTKPQKSEKVLLVGGGVGIAPMLFMAKESSQLGADVSILLGAQSEIDHILIDEFGEYGNVYLTTNDGSLGSKGFVTDHELFTKANGLSRIYCCGPDAMMHSVAQKSKKLGVSCEVSLENMMACGFGVCLCCVTKTHDGNKCVCTEGPVFNSSELSWQI